MGNSLLTETLESLFMTAWIQMEEAKLLPIYRLLKPLFDRIESMI